MEIILIKAVQLILSLSILVTIHELGHFFFARLFKIRVEKFYLFFDPWFSLFKYKPKGSDTEYGIGWLPLGGYVKIAGMIDESMDKEQMKRAPQPWEFRTKPAWQRLLVMAGGVLFNVILAILIYAAIVFTWGDRYIYFKDLKHGMAYSEVAKSVGFQDGDKIISADNHMLKIRMDKTLDMNTYMTFANAKQVTVERNGNTVEIPIPESFAQDLIASKQIAYTPLLPAVVDSVVANSAAFAAHLQNGDSIVEINRQPITSFAQLSRTLAPLANQEVDIKFYRKDSLHTSQLTVSENGTIGVVIASSFDTNSFRQDNYNLFSAIPQGMTLAKETLMGYIAQFKFVFSKEGASSLGGFASIANLFPAQWDWASFWFMTAFFSIMLAVMNILPIPALDGGHILFLLYEVISRRKPNEKVVEYATVAGMIFLFALLLYANGNDLIRAIL